MKSLYGKWKLEWLICITVSNIALFIPTEYYPPWNLHSGPKDLLTHKITDLYQNKTGLFYSWIFLYDSIDLVIQFGSMKLLWILMSCLTVAATRLLSEEVYSRAKRAIGDEAEHSNQGKWTLNLKNYNEIFVYFLRLHFVVPFNRAPKPEAWWSHRS